ncbi:MAG: hypothetical protein AB7K09_17945 [Planctomycetota bacterium]
MSHTPHTTTILRAALGLLATLLLAGCGGISPERRHAELEWQLRHHMPTWTADEWNAWEAELAGALDQPPPDPPMFPGHGGASEEEFITNGD